MEPLYFDQLGDELQAYIKQLGKKELTDFFVRFSDDIRPHRYYLSTYHAEEVQEVWLQGDLIRFVRSPVWSSDAKRFETEYGAALLLSNTCDLEPKEYRGAGPKEAVLAPCTPLETFIADYNDLGGKEKRGVIEAIQKQLISNLFYLPPRKSPAGAGPEEG